MPRVVLLLSRRAVVAPRHHRVRPPPPLRRCTTAATIDDAVRLANDMHPAAQCISAFVAIYCGLNWWTLRQARLRLEDDDDDERP